MNAVPVIETAKDAARRLAAPAIRDGYKPEALHGYTDANGQALFWRIRAKHPETGEKWVRPMRRNGAQYELGEPAFLGGRKPLYRLHEIAKADPALPVWYVEGEKCVDALARLGCVATTAGGAQSDELVDLEPLCGRRVILWADNDQGGKEHVQRVAAKLRAIGCCVEIVDIDRLALPAKGDVVDYLTANPNAAATDLMGLPRLPAPAPVVADGPILRRLSEVRAVPVDWLWPGRIARGKVTLVAGHPGLGKSQLSASLAAIVSRGGRWPVDKSQCTRGGVLLLNAEDDTADTIRPRMDAANADADRVHVLDAIRVTDSTGRVSTRMFSLTEDLSRLDEALTRLGDIALVVIDPISAYLGGTDSHVNADIRALMAPLSEVAGRHRAAFVLISHLNKGGSSEAMLRVTGSLAFVAAARAAFLVTKDPDDERRRLFLPMKNNNGPDRDGLAFRVETARLPGGIEAPRLAWESEPVAITANEIMQAEPEQRSATDEAQEFLRDTLADGPMIAGDVQKKAKAAGIETKPLRAARERLGIRPRKRTFGGGWEWSLPAGPVAEDALGAPRCPPEKEGTLGGGGHLGSAFPDSNDGAPDKHAGAPLAPPLGYVSDPEVF